MSRDTQEKPTTPNEIADALARLQKAAAKPDADKKSGASERTAEINRLEALKKTHEVGDEVDRTALMMAVNSGEGLKPTDKVLISENLKNRHKVFLTGLVDRITYLRKEHARAPGELASPLSLPFFQSPEFTALLGVYEQVTHAGTGELSAEKLDKLLKNPLGLLLVQELMDNHIRLALFGSGMLQKEVFGGAAREAFVSALLSIKDPSNPAHAEYLRQMIGVDVDKIEAIKGKIKFTGEVMGNPQQLATELKNLIETRRLFYASLGIDSKAVDILLEMGILEGERSKMVGGATELGMQYVGSEWESQWEQTGTLSKRAILEKYRANVEKDTELIHLLPKKSKSSEEKRIISARKLQCLAAARVAYMNETIARIQNEPILAQRMQQEESRGAVISTKLKDRAAGIGDDGNPDSTKDGALIQKERGKIRAQVERITKDVAHVEGMRTGFDAMESIHAERDGAEVAINKKFDDLNLTASLTASAKQVDKEKEALTLLKRMTQETHPKGQNILTQELSILGVPVGKDSFKYQIGKIEIDRNTNIENKRKDATLKTAIADESDAKIVEDGWQAAYDNARGSLDRNNADTKALQETLKNITATLNNPNTDQTTKANIVSQADTLIDKLNELKRNFNLVKRELSTNLKELNAAKRVRADKHREMTANEARVQSEIKAIEEAAQREKERQEQASKNTEAEIQKIEDLITTRDAAEKVAAEKIKSDPALKTAEANSKALENWFGNLTGYKVGASLAISDVFLRKQPVEAIMIEVNKAYVDGNPVNNTAWPVEQNASEERRKQVLMAKMEAFAREGKSHGILPTMSERLKVMLQYASDQETVKIAVSSTETAVSDKFKVERESLELAKTLLEWRTKMGGEIVSAMMFIRSAGSVDFAEECSKCVDTTLTAKEKAVKAGSGYLQFLHLVSGYQNIADPTAREKVFSALNEVLKPDVVTEKLCKFAGINYTAGNDIAPYAFLRIAFTGGQAGDTSVTPAIPAIPDKSQHTTDMHSLAKHIIGESIDAIVQKVSQSG